jgi:hypothetical protein
MLFEKGNRDISREQTRHGLWGDYSSRTRSLDPLCREEQEWWLATGKIPRSGISEPLQTISIIQTTLFFHHPQSLSWISDIKLSLSNTAVPLIFSSSSCAVLVNRVMVSAKFATACADSICKWCASWAWRVCESSVRVACDTETISPVID